MTEFIQKQSEPTLIVYSKMLKSFGIQNSLFDISIRLEMHGEMVCVLFHKWEQSSLLWTPAAWPTQMNTIQHDGSQISGTGPSDHWTGPKLGNNLGPVPDQ